MGINSVCLWIQYLLHFYWAAFQCGCHELITTAWCTFWNSSTCRNHFGNWEHRQLSSNFITHQNLDKPQSTSLSGSMSSTRGLAAFMFRSWASTFLQEALRAITTRWMLTVGWMSCSTQVWSRGTFWLSQCVSDENHSPNVSGGLVWTLILRILFSAVLIVNCNIPLQLLHSAVAKLAVDTCPINGQAKSMWHLPHRLRWPFMGHVFMLRIDSHSKWMEVVKMCSTTSQATTSQLWHIFARFGLPSITQCQSSQVRSWRNFSNKVESTMSRLHLTIPPPTTNRNSCTNFKVSNEEVFLWNYLWSFSKISVPVQ